MTDPYDWALIVLGVLLLCFAAALVTRRGKALPPPPFMPAEGLLTPEERAMVPLIEGALRNDMRLLFKIRLEDLVEPTGSKRKRRRALEAIRGRTVPFVVTRGDDFTPVGAISLGAARGEDTFPELVAAGLRVVRLRPGSSMQEARAELERSLFRGAPEEGEGGDWQLGILGESAGDDGGWLAGISPAVACSADGGGEMAFADDAGDGPLLCPECGGGMIRRQMVRGPHAGRELWTCANFPVCRKTIPVMD